MLPRLPSLPLPACRKGLAQGEKNTCQDVPVAIARTAKVLDTIDAALSRVPTDA